MLLTDCATKQTDVEKKKDYGHATNVANKKRVKFRKKLNLHD